MKKRSKFYIFTVLMCTISLLVGCGNSEGNNNKSSNGNTNTESELTCAVVSDINDINPHLYLGSMAAQGMVFESLVKNTKDGIKPSLAESWEISKDNKVYTFHLRKGVKFQDGQPFNAEAVKLNIDAIQRNKERNSWLKLSTKIVSCDVVDEYTVRLVISEPYYPTLNDLSLTRPYVFISPKCFIKGETKNGVSNYYGTGPYILDKHVTNKYAIFKANKNYWKGVPKIKKITFKVIPSGETTLQSLSKQEVNFIFTDASGTDSIDVDAMNNLVDSGKYKIVRSNPMNTKMLVTNTTNKTSPISETAVREAIWYSIDRQTICKDILKGTETVANTLFSSNVNYAKVGLKEKKYDLKKASKILEQAGWKFRNGSKIRNKNGKELKIQCYYNDSSLSEKSEAEFIQNSLKEVGIDMKISGEESASLIDRSSSGNYDLLFDQTWGLAYDPQSTIESFESKAGYYYATSGISDVNGFYKKIDEVMVSSDEKTRKALYKDILTTLHNEAVFIPISNGRLTVVAPSNLNGISFRQTQYELPFELMSFKK